MKTPRELSPYALMQEFFRDDPWKLLVCVILLNLESAKKVWPIIGDFFLRWPSPLSVDESCFNEMRDFLRPLGLQNRRTKSIISMSRAYADGSFIDPDELPGIGKYGADSYNIFVRGELVEDVQDKELKNYVRWARGVQGNSEDRDRGFTTPL